MTTMSDLTGDDIAILAQRTARAWVSRSISSTRHALLGFDIPMANVRIMHEAIVARVMSTRAHGAPYIEKAFDSITAARDWCDSQLIARGWFLMTKDDRNA